MWWPLCQYVYACISLTNNFYKTNTNTFRALRWFKKKNIWTNKKSTFCEEIHHSAYSSWIIWLWNLHYINGSLFYGNSLSYFFLLNKYFTFCNFLKVADYIFFPDDINTTRCNVWKVLIKFSSFEQQHLNIQRSLRRWVRFKLHNR